MTHAENNPARPPQSPKRRALRVVLLGTMTLCGVMMAAILLSDPVVSSKLAQTVDTVSEKFAGSADRSPLVKSRISTPVLTSARAPAEASLAPSVAVDDPAKAAPQVRVKVRRAGILDAD